MSHSLEGLPGLEFSQTIGLTTGGLQGPGRVCGRNDLRMVCIQGDSYGGTGTTSLLDVLRNRRSRVENFTQVIDDIFLLAIGHRGIDRQQERALSSSFGDREFDVGEALAIVGCEVDGHDPAPCGDTSL